MDTFITFLYDTFLPFVGDLFGRVSALAMASWRDALDYCLFVDNVPIEYVNFFTGVTGVMDWGTNILTVITGSLAVPVQIFTTILSAIVPPNTPFIVALLIFSFVNGIGIHIARFIWGIVAG